MKTVFEVVTGRSMPFWPLGYRGLDPFGLPVLDSTDTESIVGLLCWAGQEGLIELTSAHDGDILSWDVDTPSELTEDENRFLREKVRDRLIAYGVGFHMITCDLHSHPVFRRGGLTNPDPAIRELARRKVDRTLLIGEALGATWFTYWVARDGAVVWSKVPMEVFDWIADGLNRIDEFIAARSMVITKRSVEPKPFEPTGHSFLPTAGHAVGFIQTKLKNPDAWFVNPELRQHEGMVGLDATNTVRFLMAAGKLGFLHLGNQIKGHEDNDFPPLVGPEGLKETVLMFDALRLGGWRGVVEYDCHMLRAEADPDDPDGCRKEFIENCSLGLGTALLLADRLDGLDVTLDSESRADLRSIWKMCGLDESVVRDAAIRKHIDG